MLSCNIVQLVKAYLTHFRWTELFLIKHEGPRSGQERDPTRIAESVARAVGMALTSHLNTLKEENCTPLAVRITLDQDNVRNYFYFMLSCHLYRHKYLSNSFLCLSVIHFQNGHILTDLYSILNYFLYHKIFRKPFPIVL